MSYYVSYERSKIMEWFKELVIAYSLVFSDLNTKEAQDLYLEACKPTLTDEMEEAVFVTDKYLSDNKYVYSTTLLLTKNINGEIHPFYRTWSADDYEINFDYHRNKLYLSQYDYFVSQDVHDSHGSFQYSLQRGANRRIYVNKIEYYIIDTTPNILDKIYNISPRIPLPSPNGELSDFPDIHKKD